MLGSFIVSTFALTMSMISCSLYQTFYHCLFVININSVSIQINIINKEFKHYLCYASNNMAENSVQISIWYSINTFLRFRSIAQKKPFITLFNICFVVPILSTSYSWHVSLGKQLLFSERHFIFVYSLVATALAHFFRYYFRIFVYCIMRNLWFFRFFNEYLLLLET